MASVEKFESYPFEKTTASGTTYSSAGGKQAEDTVNVGQRYIRVVDVHGQVPGMHGTRPRQDACVRHPDQESYTQKQLRRPQGTAGPTISSQVGQKKPRSKCAAAGVLFSQAGHVTNVKPVRRKNWWVWKNAPNVPVKVYAPSPEEYNRHC